MLQSEWMVVRFVSVICSLCAIINIAVVYFSEARL